MPGSPVVGGTGTSFELDQREFGGGGNVGVGWMDVVQEHFMRAYTGAEMKTFHCERVRKMPLSGLDPSMLIGFLCKDEAEWIDFRRRVEEVRGFSFFVF
jgi:cysteine protease ATG4